MWEANVTIRRRAVWLSITVHNYAKYTCMMWPNWRNSYSHMCLLLQWLINTMRLIHSHNYSLPLIQQFSPERPWIQFFTEWIFMHNILYLDQFSISSPTYRSSLWCSYIGKYRIWTCSKHSPSNVKCYAMGLYMLFTCYMSLWLNLFNTAITNRIPGACSYN